MAPEFVPSLVVFDGQMDNDRLRGWCEYIEPKEDPGGKPKPLRVSWGAEIAPEGYQPVGGGVAHISPEFTSIRNLHAGPLDEGERHYRWSEGLNFQIPWVMFIFVLPAGYTLSEMSPSPAGTKLFGNRLALYWMLPGDKFNRTQVGWTLSRLDGDPNRELVRLSRLRSGTASTETVAIEDSSRKQGSNKELQRNPWRAGSFYLVAVVVVVALLIVASRFVQLWALPLVLISALLLITIVGAFQLRNDEALKDESFVSLMREALRRLSLLRPSRSRARTD